MLQQRAKAHGHGHFRTVNRIIHLLMPEKKQGFYFWLEIVVRPKIKNSNFIRIGPQAHSQDMNY